MGDSAAARARGRARRGRSRTQGEAFGGAKGEPEDADPAPISRVIRARGGAELAICTRNYSTASLSQRAGLDGSWRTQPHHRRPARAFRALAPAPAEERR